MRRDLKRGPVGGGVNRPRRFGFVSTIVWVVGEVSYAEVGLQGR